MALKLRDVLRLEPLDQMEILAGASGLERPVCSVGIADYEFIDDFKEQTLASEDAFLKDSLVISSLLFAYGQPSKILPAVETLYNFGVAAFAFKNVLFKELPTEVTDFAEKHGFPILMFGRDIVFEDIVYKVTEEINAEDNYYLSEEHIEAMIHGRISSRQIERIERGVSLIFKRNVMGAFLYPDGDCEHFQIERVFRNMHLHKHLRKKLMISRYQKGLFVIVTSDQSDGDSFQRILHEFMETCSLGDSHIQICCSLIHPSYQSLDCCIRESYFTWLARKALDKPYTHFSEIGSFQYILPLKDTPALRAFSEKVLAPLADKDELKKTATEYVRACGDLAETANVLNCHANTIRYRLTKIRQLVDMSQATDAEFYECLSAAVKIYLLEAQ